MIATFFEWKVRAGAEQAFWDGWAHATEVYAAMGSLGSSLWRSTEGHLCAFALWPDRETRDRAFASAEGQRLLGGMAPMVEAVIRKVELDPLDMRWKPEVLAQ